ncbi:MAG: hypothetical protein U0271_03300 [Polyangiaceae bacterium]
MADAPNPYAPPTNKDAPRPVRRRPMPLPAGLRWAGIFLIIQLIGVAGISAAMLRSSSRLPPYWPVIFVLQGLINLALLLVIRWRPPFGRWLLPGWFGFTAILGLVQFTRFGVASSFMLGVFFNMVFAVYLPMDRATKAYFAPDLDQDDRDDPVAPPPTKKARRRRRRETS